jgi:hypothetical protein
VDAEAGPKHRMEVPEHLDIIGKLSAQERRQIGSGRIDVDGIRLHLV